MAALADNIIAFDNCWTWYNDPRCAYDSTANILYYAGISSTGVVSLYSWDYNRRLHLQGSPSSAFLEVDDHDNPAILVLDNGKILTAWSAHNTGASYCALSTNAHDIRTWGAPVQLASIDESYAVLFQMGDTAKTVVWIFRRKSGADVNGYWHYRTSTDYGATWTTAVKIHDTEGPYLKAVQNGGNRIDFTLTTGHPDQASGTPSNSLYHGYINVANDGTVTFHKTDGTSISLPLNVPTNLTQVYDGTTERSWNWDMGVFSGSPVINFATFDDATNEVHRYHQARLVSGSWVHDEVTTGGTTATPDYLYTPIGVVYSGGIAQDRNDINSVYVSREYGSGDFRIEKWEHTGTFGSGSWSKTQDVSGATGGKNCRPYCPAGMSPTTVVWWSGTYTTFLNYNTDLRMYPAPNWRGAKESTPVWTAGYAPAGVKAYFLMHEGSGAIVTDLANGRNGTLVGSLWTAGDGGDFGSYLAGFTTSNYVNIDTLAAAINVTGYPLWVYVLYKSTSASTTAGRTFGFGSGVEANSRFGSLHNNAVANKIQAQWTGNDGTPILIEYSDADTVDGEFHVFGMRRLGNATQHLMFDMESVATDTSTNPGTTTLDQGGIGVIRRSGSPFNPFAGEIHAMLLGWGAQPDLRWIKMDLLRGQFAGTFDPDATTSGGGRGMGSKYGHTLLRP